MQQHSLLQTKLYIPHIRPELVSFPRVKLAVGSEGRNDMHEIHGIEFDLWDDAERLSKNHVPVGNHKLRED